MDYGNITLDWVGFGSGLEGILLSYYLEGKPLMVQRKLFLRWKILEMDRNKKKPLL